MACLTLPPPLLLRRLQLLFPSSRAVEGIGPARAAIRVRFWRRVQCTASVRVGPAGLEMGRRTLVARRRYSPNYQVEPRATDLARRHIPVRRGEWRKLQRLPTGKRSWIPRNRPHVPSAARKRASSSALKIASAECPEESIFLARAASSSRSSEGQFSVLGSQFSVKPAK